MSLSVFAAEKQRCACASDESKWHLVAIASLHRDPDAFAVERGTWEENEYPFSPKRKVQIANPASVLAQKILIHGEREPRDRAKDLPYIHDTIEVFSEGLEELQKIFGQEVLRSSIHEEEPASKVRPTDCSARWTMRFVKQLSWPSGEGSLHNSLPRLLKRA
jgi:hypothetical protein